MTRVQLCGPIRRHIVVDGTYLEMPKLMQYRNVSFGGENLDLQTQKRSRRRRRRRIDSNRCWRCDAIGADHPRLRERYMAGRQTNGFVCPVVKGVVMSMDERERREHRDAENAEQDLQGAERRSNSPITAHTAVRIAGRPPRPKVRVRR